MKQDPRRRANSWRTANSAWERQTCYTQAINSHGQIRLFSLCCTYTRRIFALWAIMGSVVTHCLFSFAEGFSVTITANTCKHTNIQNPQYFASYGKVKLFWEITSLSLPYSRFCAHTASLASQLCLFTHTHCSTE